MNTCGDTCGDKVKVWLKKKRIGRDRRLVAGAEYTYLTVLTVHQYNAQLIRGILAQTFCILVSRCCIHRRCQESLFQIVSHFTGPIDKKCIALSTTYWIILRYPADNLLGKQPVLSSTLEVCPKDH